MPPVQRQVPHWVRTHPALNHPGEMHSEEGEFGVGHWVDQVIAELFCILG